MALDLFAGIRVHGNQAAKKDLDGTFEQLQAGDAEVVQQPIDQPYGIRDCTFRDPAATRSASTSCDEPSRDRTGGRATRMHSAQGGTNG